MLKVSAIKQGVKWQPHVRLHPLAHQILPHRALLCRISQRSHCRHDFSLLKMDRLFKSLAVNSRCKPYRAESKRRCIENEFLERIAKCDLRIFLLLIFSSHIGVRSQDHRA